MLRTLSWVKILEPAELAEGQCKTVFAGKRAICVARVAGRYGAIDDTCPHRGASLGAGFVEGDQVLCPLHGWEFDPFDGNLRGGYPSGLEAYRTEERPDGVYVALRVVRSDSDAPHE